MGRPAQDEISAIIQAHGGFKLRLIALFELYPQAELVVGHFLRSNRKDPSAWNLEVGIALPAGGLGFFFQQAVRAIIQCLELFFQRRKARIELAVLFASGDRFDCDLDRLKSFVGRI